ncbi:MAG: TonB-dependent receptor [Bacteroidales bacterium]
MRKLWLSLALIAAAANSSGQESNITLHFDRIIFRELIDTLENLVEARFYCSDKLADTLTVSVDSRNVPFKEFIEKTLAGAGLSYFITDDNRVIVSEGRTVKTNFAEAYLAYLKRGYAGDDTLKYSLPPANEKESVVSDEYRIFRIGHKSAADRGTSAVLSGKIISNSDGEPVSGAIVYDGKLRTGTMSDNAGNYSITLPKGQHQIEFRMIGMKTTRRNVIIYSDGVLDIGLSDDQNMIDAVVITGSRDNIREIRSGIEQINVKMLKQMPMGLGEVDILKSSLLLPGIQTVGEASAGFNVRGGSTDQNLVYLNNAPILNTSHLFGFFSAFNPDLITDVTIYKSGMPSKYGGRLSSIMLINPAEGNSERIKVSGGISPVAGRLLAEGPLQGDKTTFIIGVRTTYSDWLLGLLKDYRINNSRAGFYDLQGSVSHNLNEKNSFYLSGYLSRDKFDYYTETAFRYGNFASTLKWNHKFRANHSASFYAIVSNYRYQVATYGDSTRYNTLDYKLGQRILRADFLCETPDKHKIEYGADAIFYSLQPGERKPFGDYSTVISKKLEIEQAVEPSLYISDEFEITPLLSVSGGIRGTLFTSFGPGTGFRYSEDTERLPENITDTVSYDRGAIVDFYPRLELRLSSRYVLSNQSSVKLGVQRVYQYIHMISNTTSISPTDIWKISDNYIRPESCDQLSLGFYYNLPGNDIETSFEAYYKKLANILNYKGGAILIMNEHLETDIINSNGKAYGIELMVRKQSGALTGWLSYTWSRALLRADGEYLREKINGGAWFPADYDRPHDVNFVANLKLTRRFNFTTVFDYSTGRPITFPVAFFNFNNTDNIYYSRRNSYRMPDYVRVW